MGRNRILLWLLAGVAGGLLLACSHTSEPTHEPGVAAPPAPPTATAVSPVLNVPELLALTVDELPARLGPARLVPATFIDPAVVSLNQIQAALDSARFFRYRGLRLVVDYDAKTRKLNDIVLLGRNEDLLMQQGHLVLDAPNYLLLPVFEAHNTEKIQGLRVVPAKVSQPE